MADFDNWEELLGSNNWDNLLNPLDLSLRRLILRCGDFCQATYDTFINDEGSAFCGASRFGKGSFFHKVRLDDADHYDVSSFVYATACVSDHEAFFLRTMSRESWDRESNWIGYIAVTSDSRTQEIGRREIYVAFRGTTRNYEWINVMGAKTASIVRLLRDGNSDNNGNDSSDEDDEAPKAMLGWLTIYISDDPKSRFTKLSARQQILTEVKKLLDRYKEEKPSVILTGHSLGATIATLAGFDLVENGVRDVPVTAIVFGSPRVGNRAFDERIKGHQNLKILHVKNGIDLITHYPGRILGYVNTGTELVIDSRKSPYLKDSKHPGDWHNLQAMLHVVAGWNGEDAEFEMRVKRSLALVNKSCDLLTDDCLVPTCWWVEKNKGMIKNDEGDWVMAPPDHEDVPVPEYD